jgi:hypothetical protein
MNTRFHLFPLAFWLAATATAVDTPTKKLPDQVTFNAHIRPLMSNTCFTCHGPDEEDNESGYRIDTFEAAIGALPSDDDLVGIQPGDLLASEVYSRIMGTSDGEQMPPPSFRHQLTDYDKALFAKWIEQGAKYEQHWAYAPVVRPTPPSDGKYKDLVANPIDAFVLRRLENEGITPSDLADRPTLLRRLSLDLIGLPPTPQEIEAFVNDASDDAYSRQVERLLASKHFGERMASVWLDLVRFSDTVGYHGDQNQRIFPYRDYVINAFNDNKPFDQFTREQIAGDLLVGADGSGPAPEQLTATGFLRLNMVTREGGAQPGEYLAKYKADRVRAIGTAWLGATLACCECHNHKYDPFTAKDFYSIGAFFDDLQQWGVYSDYGYTPNADLKGFNNDYPFPPELRVESASAAHEIKALTRERDQALFAALGPKTLESDAAGQWIASTEKVLARYPDGWVPMEVSEISYNGTPTKILEDRSVLVSAKDSGEKSGGKDRGSKDSATMSITATVPQSMWAAALRVEVLPDASHGGHVGRGDDGHFSLSIDATLRRDSDDQDGIVKVRPRYVRIELPGNDKILSLAEVEVFVKEADGQFKNIATGGKASQSTNYKTGAADLAIDGVTDGMYHRSSSVTHTEIGGVDPWWEVDLGASQLISKIVLWNRTDGQYSKRLTNYRIVLLDDDRETLLVVTPETPNPSLEIAVPDQANKLDQASNLPFAWSEANRRTPAKFSSGREPLYLDAIWKSGPMRWQLPIDETKQTHTAVYHFAEPFRCTPGTRLIVNVKSRDVGRLRLSLTPVGHAIAGKPAASGELADAIRNASTELTAAQKTLLASAVHRSLVPPANQHERSRFYRDEILKLRSGLAMSLVAQPLPENQVPVSRVRPRGNWQDESGELAPSGFPGFLPQPGLENDRRLTRLDLADWLTAPANPLTPRHFVNHTWKQFFGTGLSAKLDDLGNQGEWPSHPQLLDWLASEFVSSRWDVKHMVRLMVSSRTYRQQAAVRPELMGTDPYNRLLAQQSARRLEAEIIRDNALAISGLLESKYVGGPSVFPYQPDGHYANIQFPNRSYINSRDFRQYRRGLYMHWQRSFLHPMLVNFDAPARDECTAERPQSNSPQQALTLLNDPSFVEASHAMAARLIREHPKADFDERLRVAFVAAVAREPLDRERTSLAELYDRQLIYFTDNPAEAEKAVTVGNKPSTTASYVASLAAWTQVCRVILNLHETITRY